MQLVYLPLVEGDVVCRLREDGLKHAFATYDDQSKSIRFLERSSMVAIKHCSERDWVILRPF